MLRPKIRKYWVGKSISKLSVRTNPASASSDLASPADTRICERRAVRSFCGPVDDGQSPVALEMLGESREILNSVRNVVVRVDAEYQVNGLRQFQFVRSIHQTCFDVGQAKINCSLGQVGDHLGLRIEPNDGPLIKVPRQSDHEIPRTSADIDDGRIPLEIQCRYDRMRLLPVISIRRFELQESRMRIHEGVVSMRIGRMR